MRSAVVFRLGIAGLVACGANDLQPIHDPVVPDASAVATSAPEAGPRDATADAGSALGDGGGVPCKRGIASNAGPSSVFAPSSTSPGISWWYNWAASSPGADARIEFVSMLWGAGSLNESVPGGSRYLLGFNEPNFKKQANLTAAQAAADWPMVEAKAAGIPIASPGVNFCGSASDSSQCSDPTVTDPYTYLKDFFAACPGCRVDYIAVHAYDCDLPALRAYLEGNTGAGGTLQGFVQFGRPIWITELSCDASHSAADQKAFMQAAVPYLEASANVFRYAWFNAKNIPSAELTNSDGTLTDLGMLYVALPARCR